MTLAPVPCATPRAAGIRTARGFTLIELMVVVAVSAVLIMVAAPNLADMATSSRLNTASDRWIASASLARSESVKRNRPVTMCATADGSTCATGGGAQVWASGWLIGHSVDGNWRLIEREGAVPTGYRLDVSAGADPVYALVFQPTGVGSSTATAVICRSQPSGSLQQRTIQLSATGRAHLSKAPRTTACPTS